LHGGPAYAREAHNHGLAKLKVFMPILVSWVKETLDVACLVVNSGKIRPLEGIASFARNTEIVGVVRPAVLLRNDVLNMKGNEGLGGLGQTAILAPFLGSLADKPPGCGIHQPFGCRDRTDRAFA
jgi:hypothetical protein